MSDTKCSICLSEAENRQFLTTDEGVACVCSNCAMLLNQYNLQESKLESQE